MEEDQEEEDVIPNFQIDDDNGDDYVLDSSRNPKMTMKYQRMVFYRDCGLSALLERITR